MFLLQEQQNFLRTRELEGVSFAAAQTAWSMLHQHHSLEQERPLTPSAPLLSCVCVCMRRPHPLRLVIHAVSLHTDYGAETGTGSPQ